MNCRFAPVDARHSSSTRPLVVPSSFIRATLRNDIRLALHHCPEEGSGGS
jgi:hypothetical protein